MLHTWAGLSGLVTDDLSLNFLFGQGWDSNMAFAQIVRWGGGGLAEDRNFLIRKGTEDQVIVVFWNYQDLDLGPALCLLREDIV